MTTGTETTEEVSGGISVEDVSGHITTDMDLLAVTIRARAGSPDIDLNHTVLELSDGVVRVLLSYDYVNDHFNATVNTDSNLFGTGDIGSLTSEAFGIIVLSDPDGSLSKYTPVINRGDKIVLTVDSEACFGGTGIGERTQVFGRVIPEIGSAGIISFTTPASFSDTVYDLQ
jgi:flagellin FlaB